MAQTGALDQVHVYLRSRRMRRTGARDQIVDGIFSAEGHFTADDLLDRLRRAGASASRASVYRTLSLLVDGGFVETREFGRGQLMYESVLGRHHHDHLICTGCAKIVEFENEEIERLQEKVAAGLGFRLEQHSLRLFGRCTECLSAGRAASRGPGRT